MTTKAAAVPGAAPPDDRRVEPVAAEELAAMKVERDDRERMKIARLLLVESLRRLRSGRTLERAHGVVHPELTCIIRDVERLSRVVFPGSSGKSAAVEVDVGETSAPFELTAGASALASLIARASASKVAKIVGRTPKEIGAWAAGESSPDDGARVVLAARLRIAVEAWES